MTYVANSIVTVDGKEYRPGDTIQTPTDSKALGILVGIGYVIQQHRTAAQTDPRPLQRREPANSSRWHRRMIPFI